MPASAAAATVSPKLQDALVQYFSAPGKYQLSVREPALLFGSVREILHIAAGRSPAAAAADAVRVQEAAVFFIRAALLYPGADHYAVLGYAARTAEPPDLKERYRLLMRLTHPDFASPAGAAWPADAAVRVNRAYEVLSSPVLRREYDEQLAANRPAAAIVPAAPGMRTAAGPRRGEHPARLSGRKFVAVVGTLLAAAGIALLLPRSEPDQLVQRKPLRVPASEDAARARAAAPAAISRALPTRPEAPTPEWHGPVTVETSASPPQPPARVAGPRPIAPAVPTTAHAPAPVPRDWPEPVSTPEPSLAPPPAAPTAPDPPVTLPAVAVAVRKPAAEPVRLASPPAVAPASSTPSSVLITRPAPAVSWPAPTLADAQPVLTQLLQLMESGNGEQLLRLLDANARQAPSARTLSVQFERATDGAHPVRVSQVEFRGETHEGVLLVTGHMRLHTGEPTIGARGQRFTLHAEFTTRAGRATLTGLSGAAE